ncbi:hypothetical protein ACIQI7_03180 [Kitasatospora sp. NPDC092039]|uniref:hypothetical protein n=1 Tax=Kitasatospora sp. NPDC092039 TaxID=3364086 RepID=UPI003825D8AF
MGDTTIKVSTSGLKAFAAKLEAFRIDIGTEANNVLTCPPVLPGNNGVPEIQALKTGADAFKDSVREALTTIQTDVGKIKLDLEMAGTKFDEGEDHSLTEAETIELFGDVLAGVTKPTTSTG